jgi:Cu+-exporting ATPase
MPSVRDWLCWMLATPVQFGVGRRYYQNAYRGLAHGCTMGMDFLVAMGTSSAYLYSVIVFVLRIVAAKREDDHYNGGDAPPPPVAKLTPTFETGAWLITFVTLGKYLEAYARGETAGALRTLMKLQPVSATLAVLPREVVDELDKLDEGTGGVEDREDSAHSAAPTSSLLSRIDLNSVPTEERDITEVRVGDFLLVLPGGRVPADGKLVAMDRVGSAGYADDGSTSSGWKNAAKGSDGIACAYIDESAFSGEPFPVAKRPGDTVYGASVNQMSVVLIRVTATGSATVLSRIVRLVDEAQGNKAPIQAHAGESLEIQDKLIGRASRGSCYGFFLIFMFLQFTSSDCVNTDRIASIFAPCVIMLAVVTFVCWVSLLNESSGSIEERCVTALMSAISVIVVACPCALGLATPTAVMVSDSPNILGWICKLVLTVSDIDFSTGRDGRRCNQRSADQGRKGIRNGASREHGSV